MSAKEIEKLWKLEQIWTEKWERMMATYPAKKHLKLKGRARKGIPNSIWGIMWYKLSQADQISKKADLDMYEAYSKNKG